MLGTHVWSRRKWQYGVNTIQHKSVNVLQGTEKERTDQYVCLCLTGNWPTNILIFYRELTDWFIQYPTRNWPIYLLMPSTKLSVKYINILQGTDRKISYFPIGIWPIILLIAYKEMTDILFRNHTGYIDFPFMQNAALRNINVGRKSNFVSDSHSVIVSLFRPRLP